MKKLSARKQIHYYNYLINGMDKKEAYNKVLLSDLTKLENEISFENIMDIIKVYLDKHIVKDTRLANQDYLSWEDNKYYSIGDLIVSNFDSEEELVDSIIAAIKDLHNEQNFKLEGVDKECPFEYLDSKSFATETMLFAAFMNNVGYPLGRVVGNTFIVSNQMEKGFIRATTHSKPKSR